MYDVLCTGLTCCDLIFAHLEKIPEIGQETSCKDLIIKPGGAVNTPVALTRLGVNTIFCSQIGKDEMGKIVYDKLKALDLDMGGILIDDDRKTAVSAVLSVDGDRSFTSYFSTVDRIKIEQSLRYYARKSRHIHCFIEDCLGYPMIEIAKENSCTISVDAAWKEGLFLEDIIFILEGADIFSCNETEALYLTGANNHFDALEKLSMYSKHVVIKLGEKGSVARVHGQTCFVDKIEGIKPVDATGAGDCHAAGYLFGYLKGMSLKESLQYANSAGGLAVSYYGGVDQLFTKGKIDDLIKTSYGIG